MTFTVNIHEAKTTLSKLLERVALGEEIIIAKAGKPIAILTPIKKPGTHRQLGIDKGKVIIQPDFDEPLPEFDDL